MTDLPLAGCTCPGWCNASMHRTVCGSDADAERIARLEAEIVGLRAALADAYEGLREVRPEDRWHLDGYLDRAREALDPVRPQ